MSRAGHNPNGGRQSGFRRARRGGTTGGLLLTFALFGTLAATAAVVTPAYLSASGPERPAPVAARMPAHQQMIELLGSLVSRSKEVLAVHQRGASPYLEIVLWLDDADNPGRIDPAEVAVITHSEILRTISYFALPDSGEEAEKAESNRGAGGNVATSDIRAQAFCSAWRSRPDVRQRVLGAGIIAMEVQPLPRPEGGRSLMCISLTWASDLADGPDEASVLLDVLMRPDEEA
jgi:hypothetical protein